MILLILLEHCLLVEDIPNTKLLAYDIRWFTFHRHLHAPIKNDFYALITSCTFSLNQIAAFHYLYHTILKQEVDSTLQQPRQYWMIGFDLRYQYASLWFLLTLYQFPIDSDILFQSLDFVLQVANVLEEIVALLTVWRARCTSVTLSMPV